ncbi:MAG: hypothetical protein IJX85_05660 [Lachnospiraceae bacterium]|nr:hypothetical protein [Lachnospiraceae bacterium]
MDVQFKTASFGGYDKKAVDAYIEETQASHEKEVAELKANVLKLSETVKNLHAMRETNISESTATIENLKKVNDELSLEVAQLREKLDTYTTRDQESAARYESISRTLLEARENADTLARQTEAECQALRSSVEMECQQLQTETAAACEEKLTSTTDECEKMHAETVALCEKMKAETTSACQERRDSTYANCDDLKRRTEEEVTALRANAEYEVRAMKTQAEAECEELRTQARTEAYTTRMNVKRECESVSDYMAQLKLALDNVVQAVGDAKEVTDIAFPELNS